MRSPRSRRLTALVLVGGLCLGVAACGSEGSDGGAAPPSTLGGSATSTSEVAQTSAPEGDTTLGSDATSTTAGDEAMGPSGGGADRPLTALERQYMDAAVASAPDPSELAGLDLGCAMSATVAVMGEDRLVAVGSPEVFAEASFDGFDLEEEEAAGLAGTWIGCGFTLAVLVSAQAGADDEFTACIGERFGRDEAEAYLRAMFTGDDAAVIAVTSQVGERCHTGR